MEPIDADCGIIIYRQTAVGTPGEAVATEISELGQRAAVAIDDFGNQIAHLEEITRDGTTSRERERLSRLVRRCDRLARQCKWCLTELDAGRTWTVEVDAQSGRVQSRRCSSIAFSIDSSGRARVNGYSRRRRCPLLTAPTNGSRPSALISIEPELSNDRCHSRQRIDS